MKVLFILNTLLDFKSGCHFYRVFLPSLYLKESGYEIGYATHNYDQKRLELMIKDADVVSLSRSYKDLDCIKSIISICKNNKKKIAYDLDDDIWNIIDENPAICSKKNLEECGKLLLENADVVTTTTQDLANVLKKFNKNVVVIPNAIDKEVFKNCEKKLKIPTVVYSGSASHWKDFLTILPTLEKIKKEIPFTFIMVGFTQSPLDSAMYEYKKLERWGVKTGNSKYQESALECYEYLRRMNVLHFPFYNPELYPDVLSRLVNADIGICPLEDNVFNKSKSCVKFYEYGSCGIATLAPRILPYKDEVDYTYENLQDFEIKLRKLLKDSDFRKEVAERQRKWVIENRDIRQIVNEWKKVYDI
jgi:glycosyltransferase involved in cell wall biosynthesis